MITTKHLFALAMAAALAACGDDAGDDAVSDDTTDESTDNDDTTDAIPDADGTDANPTPDAAVDAMPDSAPAATVQTVACPAEPNAAVTTQGFAFSPSAVTIPLDGVVEFTPILNHNVVPATNGMPTDPGLNAANLATTCLKFTAAGTFHYRCGPHASMTGTVTVTP